MRELLMTTMMSGVESGWLFDGGGGGGGTMVNCGEVEGWGIDDGGDRI